MKYVIKISLIIILVAGLAANVQAKSITFEGYKAGTGTPVGGMIGSQGVGPQDPWYGAYAYMKLDGWGHGPRVSAPFVAPWTPGGHAATGTAASGWTSINNATPGRYVFDFQGYDFDSSFFYHESTGYSPADPEYGHEDRTYVRSTDPGEGTWEIFDTLTTTVVASGLLADYLYIDAFYDPLNAGADAGMTAWGILEAANDGGAFYNELIAATGTPYLNFDYYVSQSPIDNENGVLAPSMDGWGLYGGEITMTPVPEPATIVMLGLGALGLLRRKRRA